MGGVLSAAFPGLAEARRRRHRRRRAALPPSPPAPVCPNPAACPNGCCDESNICQAQPNDRACGTNGQRCVNCPFGTRCVAGQCICDSRSCPNGCCLGGPNGTCQPGTTAQACGPPGGGTCVNCGPGNACVNGQCITCPNVPGGQVCGATNAVPPSAICCAQGQTCCSSPLGVSPDCCAAGTVCCVGALGARCCPPILDDEGNVVSVAVGDVCVAGLGLCQTEVEVF